MVSTSEAAHKSEPDPGLADPKSTPPKASQSPKAAASGSSPAAKSPIPALPVPTQPLPEDINEVVDVDDTFDADSAYGSPLTSPATSVSSSIYRGYIENGRKYSTVKDDGYYIPVDEKQLEVIAASHIYYKVLDSQAMNPLFYSELGDKAQRVLDLGCGDGSWVVDVADTFPNLTVTGVDLSPPPQDYVPPNCRLEVDDITKPWTWNTKFDLIHLRLMLGSFSKDEWRELYRQAYDNLVPGGWIEHIETDPGIYSDDTTLPHSSLLSSFGTLFEDCGTAYGKPMNQYDTMRIGISAAGFTNVHEKTYKAPIGGWARHPVYKDAGRIGLVGLKQGMEGWLMFLLTHFGRPTPWSPEEVHVYVAKIRQEFDSGWHIYQKAKRVWAQKPYSTPQSEPKVAIQHLTTAEVSGSEGDQKASVKKQKISPPSPKYQSHKTSKLN